MANLIIDAGNTATKVSVILSGRILSKQTTADFSLSNISSILKQYKIERAIVSSVINFPAVTLQELNKKADLLILDHNTPLPLKNKYKTPETLGKDRLACAAGLSLLYPKTNCLSVDLGTCAKFDFVSKGNAYLGGSISPGLLMRLQALSHYTAKLPLVEYQKTSKLIGQSTTESILSGVVLGMMAEIDGIIQAYRQKHPDLKVILTGGDLPVFKKIMSGKNYIFANPDLLMLGLNHILNYNESNKS